MMSNIRIQSVQDLFDVPAVACLAVTTLTRAEASQIPIVRAYYRGEAKCNTGFIVLDQCHRWRRSGLSPIMKGKENGNQAQDRIRAVRSSGRHVYR